MRREDGHFAFVVYLATCVLLYWMSVFTEGGLTVLYTWLSLLKFVNRDPTHSHLIPPSLPCLQGSIQNQNQPSLNSRAKAVLAIRREVNGRCSAYSGKMPMWWYWSDGWRQRRIQQKKTSLVLLQVRGLVNRECVWNKYSDSPAQELDCDWHTQRTQFLIKRYTRSSGYIEHLHQCSYGLFG